MGIKSTDFKATPENHFSSPNFSFYKLSAKQKYALSLIATADRPQINGNTIRVLARLGLVTGSPGRWGFAYGVEPAYEKYMTENLHE